MGRVINPDSGAGERTRISKDVVVAIRELGKQTRPDQVSKDLAAFISLSLRHIAGSIEKSVVAWEKRGYWLKADRFRLEWQWTETLGKELERVLLEEDWAEVALAIAKIGQKLSTIQVPLHNRVGTPWVGAWGKFLSKPYNGEYSN